MKTSKPVCLHRRLGMLAVAVVACAWLSACGDNKPKPTTTAAAASANQGLPPQPRVAQCEPGKPGGRLVYATFVDPKTFNPVTAAETSSLDLIYLVFDGLVKKDQVTQEIQPGLAESWQVSEDKKTWTFKLRQGVCWNDGHPFTADDVVFTFNDVIYNTNIVNVKVDAVRVDNKDFAVSKVDDYTVKVVTPSVYAPFLEFFGNDVRIVPKHKLEKAVASKSFEAAYGVNTSPAELVGTGPYRLKEFKPGQYTLLERNPYYWSVDSKGQRLPYFDNVVQAVVPDQNAMSLRFIRGECDLQEFVRPDEYQQFKDAEAGGKVRVIELGTASQVDLIFFNLNTDTNPKTGKPYVAPYKLKWFRDVKFRQAISYAIDRPSIVKATLSGRGKPNYNYITASNRVWHNPNVREYPFDPAKAKALLAEIGIQDRNGDGMLEDAQGNPIEFEMNTNTGNSRREKGSVIVQDDLKRLGIKVNFRPLEFNSIVTKLDSTFDFECIFLGLASESVDPAESLNVLRSSGFNHQWFPRQKTPSTEWEARVDELMDGQLKTLDAAERKKMFDEVQAILAEQMPMIPTTVMNAYAAARKDIGNLKPTVSHNNHLIWNIEELYFQK